MVSRLSSIILAPGQLPGPVNKILQTQINNMSSDMTAVESRATAIETVAKGTPNSATFSIGGAVTDATRDVTITFKGWSSTDIAVKSKVAVWLTTDSTGSDSGTIGVKGTDFDTLQVKSAGGTQLSTAIGASGNGYLEALTKDDGTLVITVAKTTNNVKNYLHVSHLLGAANSLVIELNHSS